MNLKLFIVVVLFAIGVILAGFAYQDKDVLEAAFAAFFVSTANFVWNALQINA